MKQKKEQLSKIQNEQCEIRSGLEESK